MSRDAGWLILSGAKNEWKMDGNSWDRKRMGSISSIPTGANCARCEEAGSVTFLGGRGEEGSSVCSGRGNGPGTRRW